MGTRRPGATIPVKHERTGVACLREPISVTERLIGTADVRRTLPFNGYGDLVRSLYV